MNVLQKAKEFLLSPAKSFNGERKTRFSDALRYLLILQIISTAGTIIFMAFARQNLPLNVLITTFGFVYLWNILLISVFGLLAHFWAYVFGARNGTRQTMKAVLYAWTPVYLLGWIPESFFREYAVALRDTEVARNFAEQILFSLGPVSWIGIIAIYLWALALLWRGLQSLEEISAQKSAGAIILAIISAISLVILIVGAGLP